MKAKPEQTSIICSAFAEMQTKEDLVKVLNLAKHIVYGSKTKDFALKNITFYADPRIAGNRYTVFKIPKKQGGTRTIHAPVPGLKAILRCLNFVLLCIYDTDYEDSAMGFIPGRSIKDNAARHSGKRFVYNIDLKDFFPSIDLHRVKAVLQQTPFNLSGEKEPLAFLIANLCCEVIDVQRLDKDGIFIEKAMAVLPQGAPTSPAITNFIARKIDRRLKGVSKRFGATYTRYADDITFSSQHDLYDKENEFLLEVRRIITDQGFVINESKVRLQQHWFRQEVTGLIVNKHPNIPRNYVKQLRQWLYLWETYGYEKATLLFRRDYVGKLSTLKSGVPPLERVLEGKLLYMKMVVGKDHSTYLKLNERYILLCGDQTIEKVTMPNLDEELQELIRVIKIDIDAYLEEAQQYLIINNENSISDEQAIG